MYLNLDLLFYIHDYFFPGKNLLPIAFHDKIKAEYTLEWVRIPILNDNYELRTPVDFIYGIPGFTDVKYIINETVFHNTNGNVCDCGIWIKSLDFTKIVISYAKGTELIGCFLTIKENSCEAFKELENCTLQQDKYNLRYLNGMVGIEDYRAYKCPPSNDFDFQYKRTFNLNGIKIVDPKLNRRLYCT